MHAFNFRKHYSALEQRKTNASQSKYSSLGILQTWWIDDDKAL